MQNGNVHCHVDNVSRLRSDGGQRSAVATAAYVSGTALWNEREQKKTTFAGRVDVIHSELLVPNDAPDWAKDRESLWNAVDMTARRKDARLAKTVEVAITRDIPKDQWVALMREYAAPYVAKGMVVDAAIHEDGTNHNPHIHLLLTNRQLKPEGFGSKIPNVDQRSFVTTARTSWESLSNQYLAAAGSSVRLDRRSYKTRGIAQTPTQHRGPNRAERQQRRAIARAAQQQETTMAKQPSREDRDAYPLLTERDDWPPADSVPALDMTLAERQELARYWDDRQTEAEHASAAEFREHRVGDWFADKEYDAERNQAAKGAERPPQPWYEEALANAKREEPWPEVGERTEDRYDDEMERKRIEQRNAYERDVMRRANTMARTHAENRLLNEVRDAPPMLKRKIEDEVLAERIRRIRAQDADERRAVLEREMPPSLRERFQTFVAEMRGPERDYPEPEPGPYNDAYTPAELDKAREKMREDYERDDERDR
ncbi:MAG: hypothetical protein C0606_03500 [Hyphomicrobiales bacterium]|nr:MAG: hypothetical protein C0606_03500 [Hyphomicrobiales bacterium]